MCLRSLAGDYEGRNLCVISVLFVNFHSAHGENPNWSHNQRIDDSIAGINMLTSGLYSWIQQERANVCLEQTAMQVCETDEYK